MKLFRLYRPIPPEIDPASDPLDGKGGLYCPGRWHPVGVRMVYTATAVSLSALEVLIRLKPGDEDYQLLTISVPDDEIIGVSALADAMPGLPVIDWSDEGTTQEIGRRWVESGLGFGLLVPSAVEPRESNVLLNPLHPRIRRVEQLSDESYRFDPRLVSRIRSRP